MPCTCPTPPSSSSRTSPSPSASCCPAIPAARCGWPSSSSTGRACSTTTAGCGATAGRRPTARPSRSRARASAGPSAAAVVAELVALGARRARPHRDRGGLGATPLGALVVVDAALAADGTSRALGAGERVAADPALTGRARRGRRRPPRGLVASADIHDPVLGAAWARGRRARLRPRDRRGARGGRAPRRGGRRARWRSRARAASGCPTSGSTRSRPRSARPALAALAAGPSASSGARFFFAAGFGFAAAFAFGGRAVDLEPLLLARHAAPAARRARWRGGRPRSASFDSCASIAARRSSGGWAVRATSSKRRSSRSTPSSIPSSRCETDRSRRVSRSRSAADGQVERAHRRLLRRHGALARLEGPADRARDERVLEQVLRELAQRVLALAGDPVAEAVSPPASSRLPSPPPVSRLVRKSAAAGNVAQTAGKHRWLTLDSRWRQTRRPGTDARRRAFNRS